MTRKDCFPVTTGQSTFCACSPGVWLALCICWLLQLCPASARKLQLEIQPEWQGKTLILERELPGDNALSLTRIDGLLSKLALQRLDGTWLESDRWYVLMSADKAKLSGTADALPAQKFKAIRFRVGLNAEANGSDPQSWPPEHPLHPDVCGLHWGWQSGYVFLALEGHWTPTAGKISGFSYHLAGAKQPMDVELPVEFSGAQATTIRLGMDIGQILDAGKVVREAASSHSREGDTLAPVLKERVARSFRVKGVQTDIYQPLKAPAQSGRDLPAGTTPVALFLSERLPKVDLPPDNPLTVEGVELGSRLFRDPRLSQGNSQSCASCHDPAKAFTDGRATSHGESGQRGRRNAMTLVNLAWIRELFWDGRAKSLREQVLMPIQDAHEMNETLDRVVAKLGADRDYPRQFKAAFGSSGITPGRMALALEQFLLTLVSQESKFDHAARKLAQLTAEEQRGLQLFVTEHDPARGLRGADCFHCHGGNLFSNHQFMNNGLEERSGDRGRMEVTGVEGDRGKFKVPTLRNLALTAPYMHDGRFSTLEEVVEHYNGKLYRTRTLDPNLAKHPESGLGLSAADKAALVAFLKTLTEEPTVNSKPAPNHFSKTP